MGVEIEGNLGHNDYKLRQAAQALRVKDAEINSLKSQLEETKRKAAEKIDKLERSVVFWQKKYNSNVKPKNKGLVETKAESPGDAQ